MLLNLSHLADDELDTLKTIVEAQSHTHPSWLTIFVIDTLEDEQELEIHSTFESKFIYKEVIYPNREKLLNFKLTHQNNRINFIVITAIEQEKTKRFNDFLDKRLEIKSQLLDKKIKI